MARRSTPCTKADITRVIKAVIAAGVGKEHIVGVKLTRDGVTVLFGEQKPPEPVDGVPECNDWDDAA